MINPNINTLIKFLEDKFQVKVNNQNDHLDFNIKDNYVFINIKDKNKFELQIWDQHDESGESDISQEFDYEFNHTDVENFLLDNIKVQTSLRDSIS